MGIPEVPCWNYISQIVNKLLVEGTFAAKWSMRRDCAIPKQGLFQVPGRKRG